MELSSRKAPISPTREVLVGAARGLRHGRRCHVANVSPATRTWCASRPRRENAGNCRDRGRALFHLRRNVGGLGRAVSEYLADAIERMAHGQPRSRGITPYAVMQHHRRRRATSARVPSRIEELDLCDPRADELLVEVAASGMCATDLHGRDAYYPTQFPEGVRPRGRRHRARSRRAR